MAEKSSDNSLTETESMYTLAQSIANCLYQYKFSCDLYPAITNLGCLRALKFSERGLANGVKKVRACSGQAFTHAQHFMHLVASNSKLSAEIAPVGHT